MNKNIFSLIIPHKNCPDLLRKLLSTIPQRDDLQIIIVDDNSDPQKVDFDNFPGINRPDTEVYFEKAGKGAGYSRNVGMSHAKGKWLMFADSDDSFTSEIAIVMDKYADDEETDMVILNAQGVNDNGDTLPLRMNMYIQNYLNKRFYSEKVIRFGLWTPWSRMVKREMVLKHNIEYENIPTGNDMMFCLLCSKYAERIKVEKNIIYNYYKPEGRSLTNEYRKKMLSLEPRIELRFRASKLYKEVGYIFKPDHFFARIRPEIDAEFKSQYLKEYNRLLKKHNYSNMVDFMRFLIFISGRLLKII